MKPALKKTRTLAKQRRVTSETSDKSETASANDVVLTIGHSNHPLDEFLELLDAHGVECVVDVRTIPRSRHNPQFNSDAIEDSLRKAGIGYVHRKQLGGLRHAAKDSINMGWRNASFRGFADYMQTPEFAAAVTELIEFTRTKRCAIMCAEAVPWRCHRSLISDALAVREIAVEHIMSRTKRDAHKLTPFAHVRGLRITYPSSSDLELPFPNQSGD
ncbi:MAG: DUF488 domain-containing protein [Candidatus Acidiferrales bacterium]|jgi:uncharacterized protein (DUF488 family)